MIERRTLQSGFTTVLIIVLVFMGCVAVQLHHAINDEVVSVEYTRNLERLLESSSIEHEVYEYANGGHDIEGSSFNLAMQRTVDFYTTHLRNIP